MMRERPILFSAPMVRAILGDWKTQTRRVLKLPTKGEYVRPDMGGWEASTVGGDGCTFANGDPAPERACVWNQTTGTTIVSRYEPGDRLWVRETHAIFSTHGQHRSDGKRWGPWGGLPSAISPDGTQIAYFREGFDRSDPGRWRPSIHMPRWASRILLEITGVRVERLQDISEADAIAEGVYALQCNELGAEVPYYRSLFGPRALYRMLWDSINGRGSWDANPWVWVIEFRRIEAADRQPEAARP